MSTLMVQGPRCLFANAKLPSSKAQNCCTEKTGERRSGPEHQGKRREREGRKDERRMARPAHAFHSSLFQGGAEHNVPVVISKIFKDQVGKKEVPFSLLLRFKCGNSQKS